MPSRAEEALRRVVVGQSGRMENKVGTCCTKENEDYVSNWFTSKFTQMFTE